MEGRILSDFGVTNLPSFCNEQEVGAAGFFYLCSGCCVQIHIFVITLCVCVHNGMEAHRIVSPALIWPVP